jgi:LacI family transcriptional regulator
VAREAGVAISTVSHAFSGKRPISKQRKEQIFQIAESHGYRPHFAAQALATRKTKTLGILVTAATEQYFPLHLQAISNTATRRGYMISVGLTGGDPTIVQNYLDLYANGQVDGALVMTADVSDDQILELDRQGVILGTPLRSIRGCEELCGAEMDMGPAFRRMLDYLYSMGHRQFGFLCGNPPEIRERYDEMHRFFSEKKLPFDPGREIMHIYSFEEAQATTSRLLKRFPEITALVCTTDVLGVGAIMGAYDSGRKVPDDLSITGFDDVPASRLCLPRLTTVHIPIEELATLSVNNVLDRIEGKSAAPIVKLPLELMIRESTGTPR